jgi:tetratricopeptide (TPR) repeat protein
VQQQQAANNGTGTVTVRPRLQRAQYKIQRKAKTARLAGNTELALQLLLEGLECYPQDMHFVCAAASAAAKLGDAELAFKVLSPALQEQPHNVHLLTAAAAAYTAAGDHAAARQCYQRAAVAQPTNAVVLTAWGVLEAAGDNPAAAVGLFKQAVAAAPNKAAAYVAWARLEADRGRPWEARSLHQQAHKHCPGHVPNLHVSSRPPCDSSAERMLMNADVSSVDESGSAVKRQMQIVCGCLLVSNGRHANRNTSGVRQATCLGHSTV